MRKLQEGETVLAPEGAGRISIIRYCDILKRWRASVFHFDGRYRVYHLSELQPMPKKQTAMW